jgi:glycine/D-amino acid oxidase-like deaminating enzyme
LTNRGHDVVVYSNAPATATTSASAVAVVTPLFPWSKEDESVLFARSLDWFRVTRAKFHELNRTSDFINIVPSYEFGFRDGDEEVLEKGFPASRFNDLHFAPFRKISIDPPIEVRNEVDDLPQVSFAMNFDADMVDTQVFIPLLEQMLRDRGVQFQRITGFTSAAQLESLNEEVLFNCLGFFSRFLFPEVAPEMHPIRGQSHFIRCDLPPPYHGIASGHHAVFRHPRGFYLGSYFLEKDEATWIDPTTRRLTSLRTLPTATEMELTRHFASTTYPELAKALGFDVDPIHLDGENGIWRVNTGVRPFNVKGPHSGTRHVGTKLIVDNIGHGAHGWTIGYGFTVIAVDQFESGGTYGA